MKTIDDNRLEELRKFLIGPTQMRTPDELTMIARDLIGVIEDEQLRRVGERVHFKPDPPKPFIIFGKSEDVLEFVEKNKISNDRWKHIEKEEDFHDILPNRVQAIQCTPMGNDNPLWKTWVGLCETYNVKGKAE